MVALIQQHSELMQLSTLVLAAVGLEAQLEQLEIKLVEMVHRES
jgi:hypothetical protein